MAKILVIDDSDFVVESVKEALEPLGHTIERLESFLKLVDSVRTDPPDLILLDLEMPLLPGRKAGEYIRRYQAHRIPLLIHSSRPEPELRRAAMAVDADGWVSKTAGVPALLRKVAEHLCGATPATRCSP